MMHKLENQITKINGILETNYDNHINEWKKTKKFFNSNNIDDLLKVIGDKKIKRSLDIGGWIGLWSLELSKISEQIELFEPNKLHMLCAEKNLSKVSNVNFHNFATGNDHKTVGMSYRNNGHTGTFSVTSHEGDIQCIPIDSFNFDDVDLVKIDVEGYELFVLEGMVSTIKKCKPIIQIEYNGNTKYWNQPKKLIHDFLTSLGLERKVKNWPDCIYQ